MFIAEVTGQLPTIAWTTDIAIRIGATLKY
jgi:hypothetical protein